MLVNSRKNAFLIHLGISVIILLLILSVIFFVWYPNELIFAGGLSGLKIIMAVDLVLGPLLTLVVFKPDKKNLKFDLLCIALLQIGCLIYGLFLVHSQRPLLQVVANDGVHLFAVADIKENDINLENITGSNLKKVIMDLPEDSTGWGTIALTTEFIEGKPFPLSDDLYLDQNTISDDQYRKRIDTIIEKEASKELNELNKNQDGVCRWIPVFSPHTHGFACVNKEKGVLKLSNKVL